MWPLDGRLFLLASGKMLPLVGVLALVGLALQDVSDSRTVVGVGIGASAALLFLLQRSFAATGQIGELRGEINALKEFAGINRGQIEGLRTEAAGVEGRLAKGRHDTVGAITARIAEIQLSLTERLDKLEATVGRVVGDPTASPAGRALKAELEQLHGRLATLEGRKR